MHRVLAQQDWKAFINTIKAYNTHSVHFQKKCEKL